MTDKNRRLPSEVAAVSENPDFLKYMQEDLRADWPGQSGTDKREFRNSMAATAAFHAAITKERLYTFIATIGLLFIGNLTWPTIQTAPPQDCRVAQLQAGSPKSISKVPLYTIEPITPPKPRTPELAEMGLPVLTDI